MTWNDSDLSICIYLQMFPLQPDPDSDPMVHMFFAYGPRWKRLRNIIAPSFSTSKMKLVSCGFDAP